MKKRELSKLDLHRETIRSLERRDLQHALAGGQLGGGEVLKAATRARACDSTIQVC